MVKQSTKYVLKGINKVSKYMISRCNEIDFPEGFIQETLSNTYWRWMLRLELETKELFLVRYIDKDTDVYYKLHFSQKEIENFNEERNKEFLDACELVLTRWWHYKPYFERRLIWQIYGHETSMNYIANFKA